MKKGGFYLVIGMAIFMLLGNGAAWAAERVIKVPSFDDFTGPYGYLAKHMVPAKTAVLAWWNDTEGKKLGLKLEIKSYDTRYDASTVVSVWPGILAEKPVFILGNGGAAEAALQERLPRDKVPAIWGGCGYGYSWLPNLWTFYPQSTYVHEAIGFLNWYMKQHPEKKPLRVATMTFQSSPSFQDFLKGLNTYIEKVLEPKGLAKIVAKEWIDVVPVDVSSQLRKVADAKADIVFGIAISGMGTAYIRAQQLLGVTIPTFSEPFMTVWPVSMSMKTFAPWEGHYTGTAAVSAAEKNGRAYEFFKVLSQKYGLNEEYWSPMGIFGLGQGILAVRAVERAVRKVGSEKLTGQAVYEAMYEGPFTEEALMGILPTQTFSKGAPFSTKDMKIRISVVKDGKYQLAAKEWIPIPADIQKW